MGRIRRAKGVMAAGLAGAAVVAVGMVILVAGSSHRAIAHVPGAIAHVPSAARGESLPLPPGAAWYSETLDTSAATVANEQRKPLHVLIKKWVTWQGDEFQKESAPGLRLGPGGYMTGDSEPGFGDWDALTVHTLPIAATRVLRLLTSGRLEEGQMDRAERRSPLIWLAQLAAMLAGDPNSPAARTAAFRAIYSFPGLRGSATFAIRKGALGSLSRKRRATSTRC